jgi:hypothetical protein
MVFSFSACALPDCERLPVPARQTGQAGTQTGKKNIMIFTIL